MGSDLLLTQSQEFHLLTNEGIDSIMHIFNNEETQLNELHDPYAYSAFDNYQTAEEKVSVDSHAGNTILQPLQPAVISNEDYPGPYEFEVKIKSQSGNGTWVYSEKLKKIFLLMSSPFPVDYKWKCSSKKLYVRATPLFSVPEYAQDLVKRCLPHSASSDPSNKNIPQALHHHVLRSQNPTAIYQGHLESNIHFSVLVPLDLPQTGQDFVRVMYLFVCKNSCSTGMNRKSLEVIFTLEDDLGNVYGRKKVGARVCSCPKRDKEKEEQNVQKCPITKKKKLFKPERKPYLSLPTEIDTTEYTMTVYGKQNYQRLLRMYFDMIGSDMYSRGSNEVYKASRDKTQSLLNSLESPH